MRFIIFGFCSMLLLFGCQSSRKTAHHKSPEKHTKTNRPKATESNSSNGSSYVYLKADHLVKSKDFELLINGWLGVPHRMGGKDKSGVDCSGLTTIIYKEIFAISLSGSSSDMAKKVQKKPIDELQEGDLVFFKINGDKISHVGVYLSQNYFVHATLRRGVMISSLDEPYYKKYFFMAGEIDHGQKLSSK